MQIPSPIWSLTTLWTLILHVFQVSAINMDPTQPSQVRDAAKLVASDLVSMYANIDPDGKTHVVSGIPGLLTYPPYYWWEAGAMFGSLIEYWYYTEDDSYNNLVKEGILFQVGEQRDLMPANQSKDEGNDDQLFWAFTVMTAAELGFPDPEPSQPGWLALAQSVMNQLISRWSTEFCNGGLRWQIYQWLDGYNYKNTAANGGMFQLGARLALYTGNETYAEWATKAYDWWAQSPMFSDEGKIYDGTDVLKGCKEADKTQWTYNYGIMIAGCAYMYNHTNGSPLWRDRLANFLNHSSHFFPEDRNSVMVEVCEKSQKCNVDQWSFKAYLARWLATTAHLAPFTLPSILPILQHSAQAAARTCDGSNGASQHLCGSRWWFDEYDGNSGVGQQLSALSVIQSVLIPDTRGLVSDGAGGTSKGDPSAGTGAPKEKEPLAEVTTADKAGAGILTVVLVGATLSGGYWMVFL